MPLPIPAGLCENCQNPFCSTLAPEIRKEIAESGRWVKYQYKKLQYLFFGNSNLYIIEHGIALTIRDDSRGKSAGIDILHDGDLIGIVQLYNPNYESTISILPLTDISGCLISIDSFQRIIRNHLEITIPIIAQYSNRFAQLISHSVIRQLGSIEERVDYLTTLMKQYNLTQITQEEMALFLGVNRVTISRALRNLDIAEISQSLDDNK